MFNDKLVINLPQFKMKLVPGCRVKLGRFETTEWILNHGWYSWGGNREVCGWYLIDRKNPKNIKPLQKPDLDDIYLVER